MPATNWFGRGCTATRLESSPVSVVSGDLRQLIEALSPFALHPGGVNGAVLLACQIHPPAQDVRTARWHLGPLPCVSARHNLASKSVVGDGHAARGQIASSDDLPRGCCLGPSNTHEPNQGLGLSSRNTISNPLMAAVQPRKQPRESSMNQLLNDVNADEESLEENSITNLVASALSGNVPAWNALHKRYQPLINNVCSRRRVFGADAEDI